MRKLEWKDDWALVTGASSGIGEAFARALASRGVNLVIAARRRDRLEALATRLASRVEVVSCDLETQAGVELLIEEVDRRGIEVSHLVNNAGFGGGGPFIRQDVETQARMVELNCASLLRLTRYYLPRLVEKDTGGVIQIASLASFVPTPYMAVYGATKSFVLSLTSALAEELSDTNVRMLAVCPGSVPTGFQARAGYRPVNETQLGTVSPELVARAALRAYERGRHVVVPGSRNALAAFFSRFGSSGLKAKAAALAMKRAGRHNISEHGSRMTDD